MVAPESHRQIIRGGTSFGMIHHTRLQSVRQFRTNPAHSSAKFSVRFAGDRHLYDKLTGESPVHARHETVRKVEHNPGHVQSETVQYQKQTKNNNTTKRDPQALGHHARRSQQSNIHARGLEFAMPCRTRVSRGFGRLAHAHQCPGLASGDKVECAVVVVRAEVGRKGRCARVRVLLARQVAREGGRVVMLCLSCYTHLQAHVTLSFVLSPVVAGVDPNHKAPRKGTLSPRLSPGLPYERLGVVVTTSRHIFRLLRRRGRGLYFGGTTPPRSHDISNLPLVFGREIVYPTVCGCVLPYPCLLLSVVCPPMTQHNSFNPFLMMVEMVFPAVEAGLVLVLSSPCTTTSCSIQDATLCGYLALQTVEEASSGICAALRLLAVFDIRCAPPLAQPGAFYYLKCNHFPTTTLFGKRPSYCFVKLFVDKDIQNTALAARGIVE
ncbi:hypothetical protein JB92DRAFT_3098533 [Gautieria morchelliformis]|nr:hypothetical protein JB92DRAFT_3098533 [Gautieria morchelliformis]